MAQIVQFFTGILLMLLGFFVCISVVSGVFSSVRADEYKAAARRGEIEEERDMERLIEEIGGAVLFVLFGGALLQAVIRIFDLFTGF